MVVPGIGTAQIGPLLLLVAIALLGLVASAEVWHQGHIQETGDWAGEDWAGGTYDMEISHDGSMLMLVGYEERDEVRVMDRDMVTLGRWEPPDANLTVEGASWSTSDDAVVVWCGNGSGPDVLLLLTVPDLEERDAPGMPANETLVDVTSARLLADGAIMVVGGRCQGGNSRLLVMETGTDHLISSIEWRENATIVSIESDGIHVAVLDDLGFISRMETREWTVDMRWQGSGASPTADCIGEFLGDRIWIVGYADGRTRLWGQAPMGLVGEANAGDGPVLGVASLFSDPRYYVVAVPDGAGGSRLSAWIHNDTWGEKEWSNRANVTTGVLEMASDPLLAGGFLVAFDDGSIASYATTIVLDMPPTINITSPPYTEWEGRFTVHGTVEDEGGRVEFVRYRFDGEGEWMDANGTEEFSFVIDKGEFEPATHTVTLWTSDGVHDTKRNLDFWVYEPEPDDPMEFWYWFVGCTLVVVLVITGSLYLRTRGRGPVGGGEEEDHEVEGPRRHGPGEGEHDGNDEGTGSQGDDVDDG